MSRGVSAVNAGPRAWLNQFEQKRLGPTANLFYGAVRAGASTPEAVIVAATVEARKKYFSPWANDEQRRHWAKVLDALRNDYQGALTYAAEVIRHESLPPAEREREKQQRRQEGARGAWLAAMVGLPVTDAQIWKLGKLRYSGPPPADRAEASQLIDELTQAQGAAR